MSGTHARNTQGMHEAPRCGAKTRKGTPCEAPAVTGRKRCRMHGGAKGSGAPRGNRNALKSGLYTAEALSLRKHINRLLRESREIIEKI
jgi:hypothetical protein